LYRGERDAFTSDHLRILLAVSGKMALSIENALKYQQAENSAITDYLTGLPNARSLFLQLDRELARCKRDNSSLTVMVSDMDGFKQINDRFGHLEGNRVLRLFAQALKDSCREYDYVARMGGDEFVVIAPGLRGRGGQEGEQMRSLAKQAGSKFAAKKFCRSAWAAPSIPKTARMPNSFWRSRPPHVSGKAKRAFLQGSPAHPRLKCRVTIELQMEDGKRSHVRQYYRRQPRRLLRRDQHDSYSGAARSSWDSPWTMAL
jgi:diguanylate cyclase (GGDEF)-like protein